MFLTGPGQRLTSLDAFRGLTIAAMILVNNPGNWSTVYWPLRHAPWNGWTPTDWIFPFFLFIIGLAMAISFHRRQAAGMSAGALLPAIIRRSAILFLLGLVLSGYPRFDLGTMRIMGVLQRIALCYLLLSMIVLYLPKLRHQLLVMAGLLALYLGIMYGLDVPGHGRGVLTPAGHASGYIDRLILGENHIWSGTKTYEPEGLLSTLPAILSTFIGWLFGQILVTSDSHRQRLRQWLVWGVILTAAGWLLSLAVPINKQLWTPSYALFMGGLAGLWLSLCYWLIEVKGVRAWSRPFVMLGRNPLALFWLSGFLVRNLLLLKMQLPDGTISAWSWLYRSGFGSWLPDYPASLAFALANVGFWLMVAWGLYRKGWFIKL